MRIIEARIHPNRRITFQVHKSTSCYPKLSVDTTGNAPVSQSGAVILIRTAEKTLLNTALSEGLLLWRKPSARQNPPRSRVVSRRRRRLPRRHCNLARTTRRVRIGRIRCNGIPPDQHPRRRRTDRIDCNQLSPRCRPKSRMVPTLANTHPITIDPQQPPVVDLGATLVTAHSEKENTAPNFKRGFGFHPSVGVCRPRRIRHRRIFEFPPPAREFRFQHRRRPRCCDPDKHWHSYPSAPVEQSERMC